MNRTLRQYFGLLCAVLSYYLIHEGAHFLYALFTGTFKTVNFMGVGVQIDVYAEKMTEVQMGIFCLAGCIATFVAGVVLVFTTDKICKVKSLPFRACMYYITMIMLLLDPIYLSLLCGFFGGGDMNGISLLIPEYVARVCFGILLLINGVVFWKVVLPKYKKAFQN